MQVKEKMFLDLNSVLVKFWIENKRPDKAVKIELLERMLNWYKKMGYVTLDKQEEKKLPEGLEEAAVRAMAGFPPVVVNGEYYFLRKQMFDIFEAGARWMAKQDQSLIELAEDHAMLAGMNKMKEEMMEKAVEGVVQDDGQFINFGDGRYIDLDPTMGNKPVFELTDGDKVKVIIIPGEK